VNTAPEIRPAFEDLLRKIFPGIVIDLPEERIKEAQEFARQRRFQEKLDRMKLEEVEGYDEVVFKTDEFLDLPSIQ